MLLIDQTDIALDHMAGTLKGMRRATVRAPVPAPVNVTILALDLGTATGWAVRRRDGSQAYGTQKFPARKRAHVGQRWLDFRAWLFGLLSAESVHVVAYEDVRRHLGCDAAHAYGAFEALVQMCAATRNIDLLPVGVGVIKKAWTGDGRADKAAMLCEARRRGFKPDSDNAADALAVLSWAVAQERAA